MIHGTRIPRVLFVCTYFGARSLIAEGFCRQLAPHKIAPFCSGFEAGKIGSKVIDLMNEVAIVPSTKPLKTVFERHRQKEVFDYVVTLCHEVSAEECPVFQNCVDTMYSREARRIQWSIEDFYSLEGEGEVWLKAAREIRDTIKTKVIQLIAQIEREQD